MPAVSWFAGLIVDPNASHLQYLALHKMRMVVAFPFFILNQLLFKKCLHFDVYKMQPANQSPTFFNHFCCQQHVYCDLDVYYTHEWLVYLISSKKWTLVRGTDAGMMVIKLGFGQVYGHLLSVKLFLAIFTPNTVLMVINGSINTLFLLW